MAGSGRPDTRRCCGTARHVANGAQVVLRQRGVQGHRDYPRVNSEREDPHEHGRTALPKDVLALRAIDVAAVAQKSFTAIGPLEVIAPGV